MVKLGSSYCLTQVRQQLLYNCNINVVLTGKSHLNSLSTLLKHRIASKLKSYCSLTLCTVHYSLNCLFSLRDIIKSICTHHWRVKIHFDHIIYSYHINIIHLWHMPCKNRKHFNIWGHLCTFFNCTMVSFSINYQYIIYIMKLIQVGV